MSSFSLSRKREKVLPDIVMVDDVEYNINADFKNILRILRMLSDEKVFDLQRPALIAKWFYISEYPADPFTPFDEFLFAWRQEDLETNKSEKEEPQQFDFEFDAEEIFTSFYDQYRIDLLDTDMHWFKFVILFRGLNGDTAFKEKVALRFCDTKDLKGEELKKRKRAKAAVQIPSVRSRSVDQKMKEIEAALLGDGDLRGIL